MTEIAELIKSGQTIHLSGIGGISMYALARLLLSRGANIQGSDRDESPHTLALKAEGVPVTIGHRAGAIEGASLIIRTAAVQDANPEILRAKELSIPVLERAQAWGQIMREFPNAVCVAGTHGKTSTTSMLALITEYAGLDPTVMVGGELSNIGGSLRIGQGKTIVVESCEYKNSFLSFRPTIAVILNIDRDHLDFFDDTDDIVASFRRFAQLTPAAGTVIANYDDQHTARAVKYLERPLLTFGYEEGADVRGVNLAEEAGYWRCDVVYKGQVYARCAPAVPGRHNLTNALAAAAVSIILGIDGDAYAAGLTKYTGVGRRFEWKKEWRGAQIYDDYAHHPNEIRAALETARALTAGRVICLFQPHTYSRTASLMEEFAQALALADVPIVCPIYAAREEPMEGITSERLAAMIEGAYTAQSLEDAARILADVIQPGDLALTMGAGDVFKLAEYLL